MYVKKGAQRNCPMMNTRNGKKRVSNFSSFHVFFFLWFFFHFSLTALLNDIFSCSCWPFSWFIFVINATVFLFFSLSFFNLDNSIFVVLGWGSQCQLYMKKKIHSFRRARKIIGDLPACFFLRHICSSLIWSSFDWARSTFYGHEKYYILHGPASFSIEANKSALWFHSMSSKRYTKYSGIIFTFTKISFHTKSHLHRFGQCFFLSISFLCFLIKWIVIWCWKFLM